MVVLNIIVCYKEITKKNSNAICLHRRILLVKILNLPVVQM